MKFSKSTIRPYSLRNKLTGYLSIPLLVLLGISIVTDYREGMNVANTAYDYALFSTALVLASRLDLDDKGVDIDLPSEVDTVLRTDAEDKVFYAVVLQNGNLVAGDAQLAALDIPSAAEGVSYHDAMLDRASIRVATYRFTPKNNLLFPTRILVAETTKKREHAATRVMVTTLWTDILLIATSLSVVFFGVRHVLAPLDVLSKQIARRQSDDLSPISETGTSNEIRPLLWAINRFMKNLQQSAAAQQAFISSAAHQLRTPLTGLQTQLELAAESPPDEVFQRLAAIRISALRMGHLTKQMLALARASVVGTSMEMESVELSELLERAASDFIDMAIQRNIDLGFSSDPVIVSGSRWMLRELLSNLIDNALRYTADGDHVTVRCGTGVDRAPFLEVEDDGPGIPEGARDKVFERFFRIDEQSTVGSGLGLSIVKEVAMLHKAIVTLHTPSSGHGVLVRVNFPALALSSSKS
ncbi:MAG: hypothetical protein JWN23_476 [Rhodocyclales bacterium]|nr:hypothetical protein [Rhodocyclales bacterium]